MTENLSIAVIGAGGKMGMRVSDNLQPRARTTSATRELPRRPAAHRRRPAAR